MPHRTFGATRQAVLLEPITFDFGVFDEETFTVVPDPTLGDTFDLYDAPEPTPQNLIETSRILANFIRRMIPLEDRPRFDKVLKKIPSSHAYLIYDCALFITENITPFDSPPAESSSDGRRSPGSSSTTLSDGAKG